MTNFVATSAQIREAQHRLRDLGLETIGDGPGTLGVRTSLALQVFQRQRGLPITSELDPETWNQLLEAGWTLGSRLLYLSRPRLRGDDVAALQEALSLLGFDSGRIDGIFGHLTEHALAEFQRNCALESTGVLNRATLNELSRLSSRVPGRHSVIEARDSVGLRGDPRRLVVVHGTGQLARSIIDALKDVVAVVPTGSMSVQDSAAAANAERAAIVLQANDTTLTNDLVVNFFASYSSHSTVGRHLATTIADRLTTLSTLRLTLHGMSLPILRETLMPALVISLGSSDPAVHEQVAAAIALAVTDVIDSPR